MSLTHCQTIVLIVPRQILSLRPPFLAPVFTSLFAVRYIPHFQSQFFFSFQTCVCWPRDCDCLILSRWMKRNASAFLFPSIRPVAMSPAQFFLLEKRKIELCHSSHMLLIPTLVGVVEGALRFFFPILLWTNVTCTRARDFGRPLLSHFLSCWNLLVLVLFRENGGWEIDALVCFTALVMKYIWS